MRFRGLALRVVAVAVLVLGIVAMHHVAQPDHEASAAYQASAAHQVSAMTTPDRDVPGHGDSGSGSGMGDDAPSSHDLLHLCLAVMTAAAFLVVSGWLLLSWRAWPVAVRPRPVRVWRVLGRPPPRPHGSALLVSLCVMRT